MYVSLFANLRCILSETSMKQEPRHGKECLPCTHLTHTGTLHVSNTYGNSTYNVPVILMGTPHAQCTDHHSTFYYFIYINLSNDKLLSEWLVQVLSRLCMCSCWSEMQFAFVFIQVYLFEYKHIRSCQSRYDQYQSTIRVFIYIRSILSIQCYFNGLIWLVS